MDSSELGVGLAIVMAGAATGAMVTVALQRRSGLERRREGKAAHVDSAKLIATLENVVPQTAESRREAELSLARAGMRMSAAELWVTRLIAAAVAVLIAVAISSYASLSPIASVLAMAGGAALGAVLPQVFLIIQRESWRKEIEKDLPNALDLLCITVNAGSTFEYGVRCVSQRTQGALAEALKDVVKASRFTPMTSALKTLADNAGVRSLTIFVASLIQAEKSGMAVGDILSTQAAAVRTQRRLKIEEDINKLPLKMTFPMIFIFSSMLLVLLAPAVAQMVSSLSYIA